MKSRIANMDGLLFVIWLVLASSGIFMIFSASSNGDWATFTDFSGRHIRQIIFFGVSIIALFLILALDYDFLTQSSFFAYVACLFLLLLTLVIGTEVNGSKSWIRYGGFQIQPAEFAKTGTALLLAYHLKYNEKAFTSLKTSILPFVIIGIPMIFILLQGDFGSMMTFCILVFVFYREGFTPAPIYLAFAAIAIALVTIRFSPINTSMGIAVLLFSIFFYFTIIKKQKRIWQPLFLIGILAIGFSFSVNTLFHTIPKEYQRDRVYITLGMKEDPLGAGYNLRHSKMAISSGEFVGKGYLKGVNTQGKFIPEVETDYIFASIGEEWGFIGSLFIVGLFAILIVRLILLAERQKERYSRVFIYCAACFFMVHSFINLAMVIGLFPTVGIPLPFYSYGGSSLLSFSIIIALVLRLDAQRVHQM